MIQESGSIVWIEHRQRQRQWWRPLVCLDMLLQMILASKAFIAYRTAERPQACVDSFVSGELLVASECFIAIGMVTLEWTLARVYANMSLELSIVRERYLTVWTLKTLGSKLLTMAIVRRLAWCLLAVTAAAVQC